MAVTILDHGNRNRVFASKRALEQQRGTVIFDGDDNTVVIGENVELEGARIRLGTACSLSCGDGSRLAGIEVHAALRGHVRIGARTSFGQDGRLSLHEPGEIAFGDGCLIGAGAAFSVSDMHSVIEIATGRRLNPAQDIRLGDRVWLGEGTRVLKGATIGDGAIVGAGSLVTGEVPTDSMAIGTPARVIRRGVTWRHELLPTDAGAIALASADGSGGRPAAASIRHLEGLRRTADGRVISWAQNAEDIMLLRIFGHKRRGTWIDVGANHPANDSVTRNFYELGWRGINVEPIGKFHDLLVRERPEDTNLRCGLSDHAGEMTFYQDESNLDWSTFDRHVARGYAAGGHTIVEVVVPVTTLADVCSRHLQPGRLIDFLKLDVEGHEMAVLAGHDFTAFRPTIVIAEVQPEKAAAMDAFLGSRNYVKKWFDGTNNWYVDTLQEDAVPADAWRPAYPVVDCYHPWIYALAFPTADPAPSRDTTAAAAPDPAAAPAARGPLGKAIDAVATVVRGLVSAPPEAASAMTIGDEASTAWMVERSVRDPKSFRTAIHPDDDIYRYLQTHFQNDDLAVLSYIRSGAWALADLGQIVEWRFGGFGGVGRMLEFACGYGRLTRHLVQALPANRIWVSDIDERAVAFEREMFGVHGFPSAADPAAIRCDERFDLIVVVSLFSHLPRHAFRPMLDRLLGLLTPDGLLAFTVHDEIWYAPRPMPADGFAFVPFSESTLLNQEDYGTTFVNESFVRECITASKGEAWPHARIRRGLCSHQDIYLVGNDPTKGFERLAFRRGPEGSLDRCETAGGTRIELSGWAGDPDSGHRIEAVQVRLDGHLVQSCRPVWPRPDVVTVLQEPRYGMSGWRCDLDATPPAEGMPGPMLDVTVVSDDGRTRLLHAGRLETAIGRRLC